jgi:hypothetical protein
MNELESKKKEFEEAITGADKSIKALKISLEYSKKHLKLINEQIALENADKLQAKTLGKE